MVCCNSGEVRFKEQGNAICIEWLGLSMYGDRYYFCHCGMILAIRRLKRGLPILADHIQKEWHINDFE